MLKRLILVTLAIGAALCVYLVAEPLWLRHWMNARIEKLTSDDRSVFSQAFGDLAYDPDPRISWLILEEIERGPPKECYYQLVRVIYSRTGVNYAPENTQLPSVGDLRKLVKAKYAAAQAGERNP